MSEGVTPLNPWQGEQRSEAMLLLQHFKMPVLTTILGVLLSSVLFTWAIATESLEQKKIFTQLTAAHARTLGEKLELLYDRTWQFDVFFQVASPLSANEFTAYAVKLLQASALSHVVIVNEAGQDLMQAGAPSFSPSLAMRQKLIQLQDLDDTQNSGSKGLVLFETVEAVTRIYIAFKLADDVSARWLVATAPFESIVSIHELQKAHVSALEIIEHSTANTIYHWPKPEDISPFDAIALEQIAAKDLLQFTDGPIPHLRFVYLPRANLFSQGMGPSPWVILIMGLSLTAVLSVMSFRSASAHLQIHKQARRLADDYRASELRLSCVVDQAIDAIITISEGGIIEDANRAAVSMFGYPAEVMIGDNLSLIMPEVALTDRACYVTSTGEQTDRKVIGGYRELTAVRRGGERFPVELSLTEINFGNKRIFSGIIRDISVRKRTQAQLALEKTRFQSVIENMPLGYHLWEVDERDRLILRGNNPAAVTLLGEDPAPRTGQSFERVFPELAGDAGIYEKCVHVAKQGGAFEEESRQLICNERPRIFSINYFQCYPGAMITMFKDVSDIIRNESRLKALNRKLQLVTEASRDGFWHWADPQTDTLECSDGLFSLLGYTPQAFTPRLFMCRTMVHPEDLEGALACVQAAIRQQGTFDIQCRLKTQRGEYRWYRGQGTSYFDDNGTLVELAGAVSDIEHIKTLENNLRETNNELEQFAFIASHDLKEPVRTLNTFASYLLEDLSTGDSKSVAEDVQFIRQAAGRMITLIDDLLELSRASNVPLNKTWVDMGELVADVKRRLLTQIRETGCMIETNITVEYVYADPVCLGLVLQNLFQNAMKFQPKGQAPRIRLITELMPDGSGSRLKIADNGIGIAPQKIGEIFRAFKKLHPQTQYPGTGIGLAIVMKLVKRHGGYIEVNSDAACGTCFSITLPQAAGQSLSVSEAQRVS